MKLPNKVWLRALNKYIISSSNTLVSVSQGVASSFKKAINNQNVPVTTIYNPVFNDEVIQSVKKQHKKYR